MTCNVVFSLLFWCPSWVVFRWVNKNSSVHNSAVPRNTDANSFFQFHVAGRASEILRLCILSFKLGHQVVCIFCFCLEVFCFGRSHRQDYTSVDWLRSFVLFHSTSVFGRDEREGLVKSRKRWCFKRDQEGVTHYFVWHVSFGDKQELHRNNNNNMYPWRSPIPPTHHPPRDNFPELRSTSQHHHHHATISQGQVFHLIGDRY